ncbi:RNAPII degradation factor [Didymella pomorum]|uniref:RNA polymerase II degradation factor 1 n=1 Tax=Didymella pomorum TaxID=749634 RepID=A0A9W8ZGK7_9PLEO|nr:RNAPII degradation factor [Didymella pomorum]
MSEAQSRPARGRTTARGGRGGGYGSRGPRPTNGDSASSKIDTSAEQGELGELKKRYSSQLTTLKELFPDWSDADLVLAIEQADGDLERTIELISEGTVSQFSEVPKKAKDRSRSKATKENFAPTESSTIRGARGDAPRRGLDSGRGGRGRGTDRGRGGFRGGRGGAAAGPRTVSTSVPTTESDAWATSTAEPGAWDTKPATDTSTGAWGAKPDTTKTEAQKKEDAVPGTVSEVLRDPKEAAKHPIVAAKKTWASMFAKPAEPTPPKPAPKAAEPPKEPAPAPVEKPAEIVQERAVQAEELPIPPVADEVDEPTIIADDATKTPEKVEEPAAELDLTPSKDELTKENVEHLPDVSHPPPTETAFSTVASSKDIGSAVATPLSTSGQAPIGRPAVGGYATTALKATSGTPGRSASFQRRLMEQQEAVVMPGNHAVDRAAVQFGSLGLGGEEDVDEDREEAETRTQPPQHSPVAQPRASLPPVPRQAPHVEESEPEQQNPTPKQAPGLPPAPQQQQQQQPLSQQSPSNPLASQAMQNQGSQHSQPYNQFGRYGQQAETAAAPSQKPYDPFGQQIPSSNQYDYPGQQSHAQPTPFSSAPSDYSSQYLTSEQQRNAYQQYYNYNQQAPSQQEAGSAQQRTGSGFGSGPQDSFSQAQQSRYDANNSGHNTPNPGLGSQLPSGPASQSQQGQGHSQQSQGQHGGYPYNHPYYGSPYYANYMNQFGGYGQQQGYGSFGKGMYGQPHHYGMSPQASYEQHSSSPANAGGFGASNDRGSGFGGLGDYGRSASGMGQNHTATSGSGFGGIPDTFSRPGYTGQSSYGQQQGGQQGGDDSLKGFGDSKSTGPSQSALGAQQGRPGSATQGTPSQSAQGLHQQQSHQQGFGGYPSHLGGNSQYGGLGGLGHQQGGNQQSGYGNYGGFGGGYGGGNYNSRGGWGTNYGQH